MPTHRGGKFSEMRAGSSHLSEEWHDMEASECHSSEKWIEQHPSKGHMSEKWIEMEAGEAKGNEWHEMKQEGRPDPYSMAPSEGYRTVGFKKQSNNPMKNEGHGRYEISGPDGQSGKGL